MTCDSVRVGLISDTHGLVRPEALAFLRGCAHIVHAGDIGGGEVLARLANLAPVTAVLGNNDRGDWARSIPASDCVEIAGQFVHVVHDIGDLDIDPASVGIGVVVSGHSHRPKAEIREGVLYLNPGSAGPRRFTLPVSVGELVVAVNQTAATDGCTPGVLTARLVDVLSGQTCAEWPAREG